MTLEWVTVIHVNDCLMDAKKSSALVPLKKKNPVKIKKEKGQRQPLLIVAHQQSQSLLGSVWGGGGSCLQVAPGCKKALVCAYMCQV